MYRYISALPTVALLMMPFAAFAHEHQTFEINGIKYEFEVGSANEPILVDDKSAVELGVSKVGVVEGHEAHHHDEALEGAVAGLEKTLKVELIAGANKKTLDLEPAWEAPGFYDATFFPTEATQLSYRFFGTLEDIPIDLTFTCAPNHDLEGETVDSNRVDVAPGVVRIEKRGAFSCPKDKTNLGFPQKSATIGALEKQDSSSKLISVASVALAVLGIALARRRA